MIPFVLLLCLKKIKKKTNCLKLMIFKKNWMKILITETLNSPSFFVFDLDFINISAKLDRKYCTIYVILSLLF